MLSTIQFFSTGKAVTDGFMKKHISLGLKISAINKVPVAIRAIRTSAAAHPRAAGRSSTC